MWDLLCPDICLSLLLYGEALWLFIISLAALTAALLLPDGILAGATGATGGLRLGFCDSLEPCLLLTLSAWSRTLPMSAPGLTLLTGIDFWGPT